MGALGTLKTWIPYSTSIKNRSFRISTCKTRLGWTLEAFWSTWEGPRSLSWGPFGSPLANLTGFPAAKFGFFATRELLRLLLAFGWFPGRLLGSCLEALWAHFRLFGLVFLCLFLLTELDSPNSVRELFVVTAYCSSHTHLKHLASQLSVSTPSGCLESVDHVCLRGYAPSMCIQPM